MCFLVVEFLKSFANACFREYVIGVQPTARVLPEELQQILYFESHPPVIDEKFLEEAQHTRLFFS